MDEAETKNTKKTENSDSTHSKSLSLDEIIEINDEIRYR